MYCGERHLVSLPKRPIDSEHLARLVLGDQREHMLLSSLPSSPLLHVIASEYLTLSESFIS